MNESSSQNRSWVLTIPARDFPTLESLQDALGRYACVGQRELGKKENCETGTRYEHWQVYIYNPSPVRFKTLKKVVPTAHIEPRRGSHSEAFWYCQKDDSTFLGDRFNWGVAVPPKPKIGGTLEELHEKIINGEASVDELLTGSHKAIAHWRGLREAEAVLQKKKWRSVTRDLEVHFIFGGAGVGKTHFVYAKEGFDSVYAPGSYKNPWDNYGSESVLLLDEFNGQIEFEFFLKVLDKYPLLLPARYSDKWAGYSKVYIISNLSLGEMYLHIQQDPAKSRQWDALLRRINFYGEMVARGVIEERPKPLPKPRKTVSPFGD